MKSGRCKEVVQRFDDRRPGRTSTLVDLPILKCWPQDGGRFITLPVVHTRDPDTGERNLGMYRMQIYDGRTTGMHWQVHKVGARHGKRYYERGERMPVAITLGGDPAYTFAATAPLPDGLDEILFAGFLRKKSVELVKCETNDLEVPADVDFVLEGYVQPGETAAAKAVRRSHRLLHARSRIIRSSTSPPSRTARTRFIPPPSSASRRWRISTSARASVRIFLPVFKMNFPEIVDIALPAEGVFHNLVFVSIRKQYAYQAYKIMHGLWGMGQMMFTKYIVVVDDDCDVHNTSEVLFRLCANTDPQRDSTFIKNPSDSLDHAPSLQNVGSTWASTPPANSPAKATHRGWPELVRMDEATQQLVDQLQRKPQ